MREKTYSKAGEDDLPVGSILRNFCEVCGKKFYTPTINDGWEYATHKGERIRVCRDCKRAIELKDEQIN